MTVHWTLDRKTPLRVERRNVNPLVSLRLRMHPAELPTWGLARRLLITFLTGIATWHGPIWALCAVTIVDVPGPWRSPRLSGKKKRTRSA